MSRDLTELDPELFELYQKFNGREVLKSRSPSYRIEGKMKCRSAKTAENRSKNGAGEEIGSIVRTAAIRTPRKRDSLTAIRDPLSAGRK